MSSHFQVRTGSDSGALSHRALLAGIIAVTLLGFYLRYRCLGCLGFRWDEDLTSLAVKALLEKGVPELPSGMIYLRFYPYQWIVAASVKIFGFSEFSMRLPAVIFGTILIPTAYWISGKLFNKQIGLIVAACVALSFWQVEMTRTARMYAPFFLVYLIAAYAIFRAHFQNPDKLFSPWVLPLAFLTLSFHQLAYSLAIILLLAIPLRRNLARTTSLLLQAGGIGIGFIVVKSIEQRYFDIPLEAADTAAASQSISSDTGPIAALFQQISLPNLELLAQVYGAFTVAFLTCFAILVLAMMFITKVAWRQGNAYRALVIIAIGLSVAHQFNLVVMTLVIMLILLKGGIRETGNPAWYRPALVCLALFFLWLITIAVISMSTNTDVAMADLGFRKLLRALLDYPNFRLFWSYVLARPILALPFALGTLWGIDKIARDKPDAVALFLVGGFWLVLFANGVLKTKFEFFRYNLHIDPFFLMLVVAGLFAIPNLLANFGFSLPATLKASSTKVVYPWVVATIAIAGVNPIAAVLTSDRDYTEKSFPYTTLGLDRYDDFKTPAAYVSDHLQSGDIILVLDPREYWNYIGRVDYWLRSSNYVSQTYQERGRAFDRYLGIPLLHSSDEVRAIVDGRTGGGVWILFSQERLARTPWVSADLKAYLNGLDDHIVYVGRDEQTVVIRLAD
jgi:hypothetical protein